MCLGRKVEVGLGRDGGVSIERLGIHQSDDQSNKVRVLISRTMHCEERVRTRRG
jgi:hypothetical protein